MGGYHYITLENTMTRPTNRKNGWTIFSVTLIADDAIDLRHLNLDNVDLTIAVKDNVVRIRNSRYRPIELILDEGDHPVGPPPSPELVFPAPRKLRTRKT